MRIPKFDRFKAEVLLPGVILLICIAIVIADAMKPRTDEIITSFTEPKANTVTEAADNDTEEYDLLYIYPVEFAETNGYGNIESLIPAWRFGYIDEEGKLVEIADYHASRADHTDIIIGDVNAYIIADKGSMLRITEDTLRSISSAHEDMPN